MTAPNSSILRSSPARMSSRPTSSPRRHNTCFGIVNVKRLKGRRRAFDDCLFSFNEIQNVHTIRRVVFNKRSKPVPSGLNEFQFVQSGSFFFPAPAFVYLLDTIQQILPNPFCVPVPLNVSGTMF